MPDNRTGTPIGRTLAIACNECKFAHYFYTALPSTLKILARQNFKYCPLCGKEGIPLTDIKEVSAYDASYKLGLPIEAYKQILDMYMEYLRTRNEPTPPTPIRQWIKELFMSVQHG